MNVASDAALVGQYGQAAYCASKGGVAQFSRAAALDAAPFDVRVNCVCPGLIQTDITGGLLTPEMKTDIRKGIPMDRLGEANDVAGAFVFLASDLSSYITGAEIDVNGGMHIH